MLSTLLSVIVFASTTATSTLPILLVPGLTSTTVTAGVTLSLHKVLTLPLMPTWTGVSAFNNGSTSSVEAFVSTVLS